MTRVKDPVARAQRARTHKQAAQLRDELEPELALADHGEEWNGQAEQALAHLKDRHGNLDDLGEYESDITLSRAAQAGMGDPDPDPTQREPRSEGTQSPAAGPGRGARANRVVAQRALAGRRRAVRGGRSAYRRSGVQSAGRSTSQLLMQIGGWGLGLSLLYLLLTRGGAAADTAAKSIVLGTRALVDAHADPLSPGYRPVHAAAPATSGSVLDNATPHHPAVVRRRGQPHPTNQRTRVRATTTRR